MLNSSSVTTFDSADPAPQTAAAIVERLLNVIPPERIAGRIKDMLEATTVSPSGAGIPDWRTVEAGVMLYLAWVRPVAPEIRPALETQTRSHTSNSLTHLSGLQGAMLTRAGGDEPSGPTAPPPAAKPVSQRHPEPLDMMRKMMVADPHMMKSGGEPGARKNPWSRREASVSARSGMASHELAKPAASNTVLVRQSRRLAMLLVCTAAAWLAGHSHQTSTAAPQVAPNAGAPRPAVPAAAAPAPQRESLQGWFLEDLEAEYAPRVAHWDLLE